MTVRMGGGLAVALLLMWAVIAYGAITTWGPNDKKPATTADWRMSDKQLVNEAKRVIRGYFAQKGIPVSAHWWQFNRIVRRSPTRVDVYVTLHDQGPRHTASQWRIPMQRADYITLPPVPYSGFSDAR